MGVVNHEENEGRTVCIWTVQSMIISFQNVSGPRFVNPFFYSLAHDVLSVCISVASM